MIENVKRGITLKASDMDILISDQESSIKCLRTSQIASGFIDGFSYYHGETKKPYKNSSSCGDILISKVGTPFKVALSDGEYLIVGNVYIIKVDRSKVSPEYIKCFLSSAKGQEEIAKLAVGTNTPILNISDLEKIRIPVFEKDKQMKIEQRAYEIVDELSNYHHQIKELNEEISSIFE
ncbi:MAG: restriction endonuclease subunit S [Lachnospiraceae bacterium]|nr:restriction endonuclease subunit S [Lachnospiraceae bacterium]